MHAWENWVHVSSLRGTPSQLICGHYEHVLSELKVGESRVHLPLGFVLFNDLPTLQLKRRVTEKSIVLLILGRHFSSMLLSFSLKVRASKPQRNAGCYCYHYSYNDKVYSVISLCCSCLFCKGILISVGMSENKSYIVRQEPSLATKIKGPSRDLSTTSEYETVRAEGQT